MNVVLIMAKEGSIGLPGKNLLNVHGKTLLQWVIEDANKNKLVDKIFVSTNGDKISRHAKSLGAEIILREDSLAKNENFLKAVDHAIEHIKKLHSDLNIIAIPQCVVPFRDPDIFDRCISFLIKHLDYDSAVTIRQVGFIPEALMKVQDGDLVPYFPEAQSRASGSRQDSAGFEIDHTVECFRYASWLNRSEGIRPWNYLGRKIKGIPQHFHNRNCFVDVHTATDVQWLNFIVEKLGYKGMVAEDEREASSLVKGGLS